jgi:hypothetical protein
VKIGSDALKNAVSISMVLVCFRSKRRARIVVEKLELQWLFGNISDGNVA